MTELDGSALTLVVCGAPLAERAPEFVHAFTDAGYSVRVVVTDAARDWLSPAQLEGLPTSQPRRPGEPRGAKPGTVVVLPLTFNSLNQWALGISNTPALGALNGALGTGARILAVPVFNETLWTHPVVAGNLDKLEAAGVQYINANTGEDGAGMVRSGTGNDIACAFAPEWITDRLT